jgi:hypothetical protein
MLMETRIEEGKPGEADDRRVENDGYIIMMLRGLEGGMMDIVEKQIAKRKAAHTCWHRQISSFLFTSKASFIFQLTKLILLFLIPFHSHPILILLPVENIGISVNNNIKLLQQQCQISQWKRSAPTQPRNTAPTRPPNQCLLAASEDKCREPSAAHKPETDLWTSCP